MATTGLGRLTLDLAVRMSDFTDGMSRAERETADATRNMSESVTSFKDTLLESLSGSPIGGAIDGLNAKLGSITEAFGSNGLAGAAKVGGLAIAGAMVGATGAIIAMTVETAKADVQLERLAKRGNTTTANLQVLTAATKVYGLEMEGVGDILADAQEKLGEFAATGGGGLTDTLDIIQEATKKSDAEMKAYGERLSSLDTKDAIQLIVNDMEEAGASTQKVRFATESLASGLGDIIPLWDNNGEALRNYERDLTQAGVIRTKESIEQTKFLAEEVNNLQIQYEGLSNQIVTATLPAMVGLTEYMKRGTEDADGLSESMSAMGIVAATIVTPFIGLLSVFKQVGTVVAGLMASISSLFSLMSNVLSNPFKVGTYLQEYARSTGLIGEYMIEDMAAERDRAVKSLETVWSSPRELANRRMAQNYKDTYGSSRGTGTSFNSILNPNSTNGGIPFKNGYTGTTAPYSNDKQTAALTANTAAVTASTTATKSGTTASKADTSKFIKYANSGASRNEKLTSTLEQKLSFLEELGVAFKVGSGGQSSTSRGRVGSTAHNGGNAGDGKFIKDGRALSINRPEDRKLLEYIVEQAASRGINGIGAANNYMGAETFHLGIQQKAATWGKDGKGINALPWITAAHRKGLKNPVANNSFEKQMYSDNAKAEADKERKREQDARDEAIRQTAMQNARDASLNEEARINLEAKNKVADTLALFQGAKGQEDVLKQIERDRLDKLNALDTKIMKPFLTQEDAIQIEYLDRVKEASRAYGEGSVQAIKASENALADRDRALASLREDTLRPFLSASEQLKAELDQSIKDVEAKHGAGSATALQTIEYLKSKYEVENAELEYLAGAAERQAKALSDVINSSSRQATEQLLDNQAKSSMSPEDFELYSATQSWQRGRSDQQGAYEDRESEINAVDSKGDFLYKAEDRNKLLEEAYEEHLAKMALLDDEYANRTTSLAEATAMSKLSIAQANVNALGTLAGALFGQQSTAARAVFAMEKGLALQRIFLESKVALSKAWASAAFPYNLPAVAMAGLETGALASAVQTITPMFSGVAHGGMDYIPSESTFLLDKGERVLSPRQNKDLTDFLSKGGSGSSTGETNISITIDNNGNANMNSEDATEISKHLSLQIKNLVQATLRQEKYRQGGMLNGR